MSDSFDLESILQSSLEYLEQGESIQACLARFPDQAAELAPLLETVVALRSLAGPPPRSKAARAAARARFLAAVKRQQAQMTARTQAPWQRWHEKLSRLLEHPALRQWTPVLGGMFLVFLLISGTMRASATSLPGDWLYPIKLVTEQIQLLVTSDASQRILLEREFRERRRMEAKSLIERGRRARVAFSGFIEEVTPGMLRVAGLTIRLGYETRVWGTPKTGAMAQVDAISQSFGELIALKIEIFEPSTPVLTSVPLLELTATPTSQPTPTRAIRPRVQLPQRRAHRVPVVIPTRPLRSVRLTPIPLSQGVAIPVTPSPLTREAPTVTLSPTDEGIPLTSMPTAEMPVAPSETAPVPTSPSEATPILTEAEPAETPTAPVATLTPPPPEETSQPAPTVVPTLPSQPTAVPAPEEPTSAPPPTVPPLPPTEPPSPAEPPPPPTAAPPPSSPPPSEPGKQLPTPPAENPDG